MSDILDILSALSPVLGGAASANQKQNNTEDALKALEYHNTNQDQLARDKFAAVAPSQRMGTAARASVMNNFQPTSIAWGGKGSGAKGQLPTYSGGAVGGMANLDPRAKATADSALTEELASQLKGAGGGDSSLPTAPTIGAESLGAKALGAGATAASVAAALKNLLNGSGPSSGGDLKKLLDILRGHGGSTSGNTGQPTGDNIGPFDPGGADEGANNDYGPPTPGGSVSTDTSFNGVPGGFPNSPEDPLSADPNWWEQFAGGGGNGDSSGYGEPGPNWGG